MANKQPVIDKYIVKCEQEILTSILVNPSVADECVLSLVPDDFADANNRIIYSVIYDLYFATKQISYNVVCDYIANNPKSQFANWENYLEELNSGFSYEEDLKSNIELVKNASIKRNLDAFAAEIVDTKIDFAKYNNQIFELEKKFMDIIQSKHTSHLADMHAVVNDYYNRINKLRERRRDITGTSVGFSMLDKVTNGFQPDDLIILAARPGVGKTAISLNFVNNAATIIRDEGRSETDKVVVFSLEMGKEQLCQRLVSLNSSVVSNNLRSGRMDDMQWASVKNSLDSLSTLPILIDDTADMSIVDIQSKLKQLKNNGTNIKLVIIDYIQLLKGPRVKGVQVNRQQEVSTISRMLKLLAREIHAPIIALAQLSRKVEDRGGGSPMLSDLRESGSLEQDADLVCFLSRNAEKNEEETTVKAAGPKQRPDSFIVNFEIAKHRNGEIRNIQLVMDSRVGKFTEISANQYNAMKEGNKYEAK